MRVISGYLKGRNILGYNIPGTRPTMDRVKESMFASIQDYIDNSTVLDLFCGTGSLGIEALSMGSNKCYFVDNGKEILKYLNKNIDNLNIKDKSIVINKDYKDALLYNNGILVLEYSIDKLKDNYNNLTLIKSKKYNDKYVNIYHKVID